VGGVFCVFSLIVHCGQSLGHQPSSNYQITAILRISFVTVGAKIAYAGLISWVNAHKRSLISVSPPSSGGISGWRSTLTEVFKCSHQESNLIYDLRKVACARRTLSGGHVRFAWGQTRDLGLRRTASSLDNAWLRENLEKLERKCQPFPVSEKSPRFTG